ncbi:ribosome biogenesis GTPase Der [Candidatus Phytoplasma pini]|uniref:GTPase Der n=1 Tax=Candidatus Phytoplasma pini TaxID=267362 RepID=A0A559KJB7_9MOLU|nr:ribosome biogenesis GTPase Der [Candidatus Phytoplasma pini]TVY12209.1 GTP-binding protein [Candidatus Phytoplasma pini]
MFKVAIVGRPNVGKSSLFNRMLKKRLSIIYDEPGTTKDRIYAKVKWLNQNFFLIDTGGIIISDISLEQQIKFQTELAIEECHLIILVTDGQTRLVQDDLDISRLLNKVHKKVIVAVNKIDNLHLLDNVYEFYNLGFQDVLGISCQHGIGIGELLDKIIFNQQNFFKKENKIEDSVDLKFCLIGRPNVGKSTLKNAILSQERMIVSDMPYTTTDSVDTLFTKDGQNYHIIDTAGLRKKGKINNKLEKYSFLRTMDAIERSDIVCFVLDASQAITDQDRNIASLIFNFNKSCILIYNKWDLVDIKEKNMKQFEEKIKIEFKFFHYMPIVFLSAKNKKRISTLFSILKKIFHNYNKIFSSHLLNDILYEATQINPSHFFKQGKAKFYFLRQNSTKPPKFICLVNDPKFIHFSYERFLKNQLRFSLGLEGIPLIINFKKKEVDF